MQDPILMVIIPSYNEAPMIEKVLKSLPRFLNGVGKIIPVVIDDGSTDGTYVIVKKNRVRILRHVVNRGLGGAIGTGFAHAERQKVNLLVTMDADGQHKASDMARIIKPILTKEADVVIGSRQLGRNAMPMIRRVINTLSNIVTWIFFGIWTSDSQSGYRAFSQKAIRAIKIRTQRMEVSSEMFKEIKRNHLKMVEIPISTVYTSYSLKKGQKISNAPDVFAKLLLRTLR